MATGDRDDRIVFAWIVRLAGTAGIVTGGVWLWLWLAGRARAWSAGAITPKANNTVALLVEGLALVLAAGWGRESVRRTAIAVLGCVALLLGSLTLTEHFTGWDLGIDQLLAAEPPGALATSAPNRMGPAASVSHTLFGTALVLFALNRLALVPLLGLLVCLVNLVPMVGFLYGIDKFYLVPRFTGIAWPTVVSLSAMGVGLILLVRDRGPMALVLRRDEGGALLRRLLPAAVLGPLLLGMAAGFGERAGLWDSEVRPGLLVIALVLLFSLLLFHSAALLSRQAAIRATAEEALRKSRRELASLADNAPDIIVRFDREQRHLFVNRAVTRATGRGPSEFIGKTNEELNMPPENCRIWRETIDDVFRTGLPAGCEFSFPGPNGARHFSLYAVPERGADGSFATALCITRDVTSRKRAELALRESEQFYRQTLESIPGMVFTTRPDGYCDYQSQQWADFTGVPVSEHLGDGWTRLLHPDDRGRASEAWLAAVQERAPYDLEYRVRRYDGLYEWFKVHGRPIRDTGGHIVRWFGVAANIDALKKAEDELRRTSEDLTRSNRELEQFAYVASHDLVEPLRQVRVYSQLLQRRGAGEHDGQILQYLEFVADGARRMNDLVQDLLAYSRLAPQGKLAGPASCQEAFDEAAANLRTAIEEAQARLTHDELPSVAADTSQLARLFQNLISNAIKFRREGVPPEISIGARRDNHTWVLWVEDNGIGIAPEYHDRVFQVFKRLHGRDKYAGTGIGLAICKKIVEQHGGRIWVESDGRGTGSRFCFTLPAVEAVDVAAGS